jgi:hypothetical protein
MAEATSLTLSALPLRFSSLGLENLIESALRAKPRTS